MCVCVCVCVYLFVLGITGGDPLCVCVRACLCEYEIHK
jgi:hypothetical protein